MDVRWDRVASFWQWVEARLCPAVASDVAWYAPNKGFLPRLEAEVSALGPFDFEVGPYGEQVFLALSPRGVRQAYAATREIVARAPAVPGWVFLPAKPKKPWDLSRIALRLRSGQPVLVNATAWQVVVHRFKDGLRDIVLVSDDSGLSLDDRQLIATTIVDGEVGEGVRIDKVNDIEVVEQFTDRERPAARRLVAGLLARALAD